MKRIKRGYMKSPFFGILIFNMCLVHIILKRNGIVHFSVIIIVTLLIREIYHAVVMHYLEKEIVNPFNELKYGLEEVMKENYNVHLVHNETDEIGMIMDSFNKMTACLSESKKIKAEYAENRKMLVANIAHDLKTPIACIQGYAEAVLDQIANSPDKTRKYIEIILNNSMYMNCLIEELILFTKLDTGKLEFEYELIDISDYMDDLMEELKIEIEEQGFGFSYDNQLKMNYLCKIDGKKLYRAIRNIIYNSVKYSNVNWLVIQVKLYADGSHIELQLMDNGVGIPAEKIDKIFERFYRIDPERTKDFMSSGLGLPIAKELVELHGGTIQVSSKNRNGVCFKIRLPIVV
ncbi:HAMP domain-containing sensor histidine kinase [Anaeromicropila populeti]|uniref:histidine kinase n=1 Tax=Anaeromicropila populeti TaxID=37658 RepID=A0A1I6HNR9_9FIRM|nr:HAMP domain-containing sensor histidine kinase [Anaeromicropila populeti]SFR56086.1 Signal transduction histidine kinase [Anaeromicropila populeti]